MIRSARSVTPRPPYIRRPRNALSWGDFSTLPQSRPLTDPFYHKEKRRKKSRALDADAWLDSALYDFWNALGRGYQQIEDFFAYQERAAATQPATQAASSESKPQGVNP